jgi:hypothetical protein
MEIEGDQAEEIVTGPNATLVVLAGRSQLVRFQRDGTLDGVASAVAAHGESASVGLALGGPGCRSDPQSTTLLPVV